MNQAWRDRSRAPDYRAFTLVELMVAMAIFLVMLGIFAGILNSVHQGWERAQRETEIAQNARAILGLLEKDLTSAIAGTSRVTDSTAKPAAYNVMQFGQNPNLTTKIVGGAPVPESDSIFFWSQGMGGLSQVGWYLASNAQSPSPNSLYELRRFHRPAEFQTVPYVKESNLSKLFWLEGSEVAPIELNSSSRIVSERILGFWIECLDAHGRTIPWLSLSDTSAAPLKFNSAARFQMAPESTTFANGSTFHYTAPATAQANMLPAAVRITLLITDEGTLIRHRNRIPGLPARLTPGPNNSPDPVESAVTAYQKELSDLGIRAASFSTVVKLTNTPSL